MEDDKLLQYAQLLRKVLASIVMLEVETVNYWLVENSDIFYTLEGVIWWDIHQIIKAKKRSRIKEELKICKYLLQNILS